MTSLLLPLVLVLLRPLTLYHFNVVPAGPTPLIFALLAQYQAMIPAISKRHIVLSTSSDGITISDKTLVYFITAKLAFSSLAGSLLAAVVGWGIGVGWRANFSAQTIRSWQNLRWKRGGDAKERNVESSKSKPERGARGVGSATDFDSINSRQRR